MDFEIEIDRAGEKQTLRVAEHEVVCFPGGLVGCPDWRRFVLIQHEDDSLVGVLHCLDEPGVTFLVTDPTRFVPGYRIDLADADLAALGRGDQDRLDLLAILAVDHERGVITANLLGPLAINSAAGVGVQAVQLDSDYTTRHVVAPLGTTGADPCSS